jgi:hypothetical protein
MAIAISSSNHILSFRKPWTNGKHENLETMQKRKKKRNAVLSVSRRNREQL